MASPNVTVEITPSPDLLEAVESVKKLGALDFEALLPLALRAADITGEYYRALVAAKLPSVVIDNLVYDFHRLIWNITESNQE